MRRLLILMVLACPAALAQPAWVQSDGSFAQTSSTATSQTDTLAHTSAAGNDLVAFLSLQSVAANVIYVCGGTGCTQTSHASFFYPYTGQPGDGTSSQIWICHKCAATSAITVSVSAGTVWTTQIEEYSGVAAIGQVVSAIGSSIAIAASLSIQEANNIVVMSTSSLANHGIPASSIGNLRDANRSGTTSSFNSGSACDNTSATAGASVTCQVGIVSGVWTAVAVELRGGVAAMTYHVASAGQENPGGNESVTVNNISTVMTADPVLSGNTVVCMATWPYAAGQTETAVTASTMGGAAVDTFTKDKEVDDTSGQSVALFHAAATAGTQYVKWTFGTALAAGANFTASCTQFRAIAAASPVDATCGVAASGPEDIDCGGLTTTVADIVFTAAVLDGVNSYGQGYLYCAGGYDFSVLIPNNTVGYCTEYQTDNTPGSADPRLYVGVAPNANIGPGAHFNVIGVAYKVSSGQGTAPSGIYIARQWTLNTLGPGIYYANLAAQGNVETVAIANNNGATQNEHVWDTNQATYAWNNADPSNAVGSLMSSSGSSLDASSAGEFDHTGSGNDEMIVRDIAGAASSPFDTPTCPSPSTANNLEGATGCYDGVNQSGGLMNDSPDVSPSVATQTLTLVSVQNGNGPITGGFVTPSGAVMDCPVFAGQTDSDPFCEGNGYGHFRATATARQTYEWNTANLTNFGNSTGYVLKAAPAAPPAKNAPAQVY